MKKRAQLTATDLFLLRLYISKPNMQKNFIFIRFL